MKESASQIKFQDAQNHDFVYLENHNFVYLENHNWLLYSEINDNSEERRDILQTCMPVLTVIGIFPAWCPIYTLALPIKYPLCQ